MGNYYVVTILYVLILMTMDQWSSFLYGYCSTFWLWRNEGMVNAVMGFILLIILNDWFCFGRELSGKFRHTLPTPFPIFCPVWWNWVWCMLGSSHFLAGLNFPFSVYLDRIRTIFCHPWTLLESCCLSVLVILSFLKWNLLIIIVLWNSLYYFLLISCSCMRVKLHIDKYSYSYSYSYSMESGRYHEMSAMGSGRYDVISCMWSEGGPIWWFIV